MPEYCKKQKSLYILHVSVWFHLPGPLWLLPDVVSIIYPASIGQYWSRLSALLPYWQQDNGVSNHNGTEKKDAAVLLHIQSGLNLYLHSETFMRMLDSLKSGAVIWQRSTLPVSSPSENTPSSLFSCCLIVDNEIKVNRTESNTEHVSNVSNFPSAKAHTIWDAHTHLPKPNNS